MPWLVIYLYIVPFVYNYDIKLTKLRKSLFSSVSAGPILLGHKQTQDDKYVDLSHLFQNIHKFFLVLVYFGVRQNQN